MSALRAAFSADLRRYRRSWGLWLLLVVAAAGARFLVARDDGSGIQVAVGRHLPSLDWPTLGVCLGVVVATVLLPVAFIYLRANTTRAQPWQVDEVTPASRVAIALGRFAADVSVLAAMLGVLTAAGAAVGIVVVPGPLHLGTFATALWLIAAPPLAVVAGVRSLLDAHPAGRRAGGDALFFVLWLASLTTTIVPATSPASYRSALADLAGFVRPLTGPVPAPSAEITIGATSGLAPGRVPLNVGAGLASAGYVPARLTWLGIAALLAAGGGLLHVPHVGRRARSPGRLRRLLHAGLPPAADVAAPPARAAQHPALGLLAAEARLIGAGRLFKLLALLIAVVGVAPDYRHIGGPAALLLLAFALSAHAGRADTPGLRALTGTAFLPPLARRAAFTAAGLGWSLALALPAAVLRGSVTPLVSAAATGLAAALVAVALGWATGSATAARIVLLVGWYAYLAT